MAARTASLKSPAALVRARLQAMLYHARLGRLGRLGAMAGGGGGSPSITSPGSIDAQPLVGQVVSIVEPSVTGASSTAYQWYRGAPTTTPIGGATSASYTAVSADYGLTLYRRATYTSAGGDTVDDLQAPNVVGQQFFEDFSGMTNGDNSATILAYGWTRNSTSFDFEAITDADAPSGLGLNWWGTAVQTRSLYRNDWDTFSNANSADDYEELILYKHLTNASRVMLRPHNGAGLVGTALGAGFAIRLGVLFFQLPGEDPNDPAATGSTNLGALTIGQMYWFRKRSSGATAEYKFWNSTVSEPDAWNSRTHGSALANRGPTIGYRAGGASDKQRILYMSSGHRTSAPFPVDFELPLPSSADVMIYAASASASSFVTNGLITWSF